MPYAFLADFVVFVHCLYVGFVVVGQLLIVAGIPLGWGWVRNPWFRALHLAAICIVAVEAFYEITCPLTHWESQLRELAGQPVSEASFLGRLFNGILFYEDADEALFRKMHMAFGALVLLTFFLAPPRFRRRAAEATVPAVPAADQAAISN